jgi:Protein of unknown function (DUF664)
VATTNELLSDAFERVRGSVHRTLDGLDEATLAGRVDPSANSIGWLVWHLTRVQDDHVAELAGRAQVWTSGGWAKRFGLPFDAAATGYGQSSAEVAAVQGVSATDLAGYFDDVHAATLAYLAGLDADALDRVVDTAWDPPVTVAVRLVSVLADDLQHVGQAAFIRGVLSRRE